MNALKYDTILCPHDCVAMYVLLVSFVASCRSNCMYVVKHKVDNNQWPIMTKRRLWSKLVETFSSFLSWQGGSAYRYERLGSGSGRI
jgi:hypothetical protein